ncbi:hypothetical protein L195_g050176, partial [Trifolium pratense]
RYGTLMSVGPLKDGIGYGSLMGGVL